MQDKVIKYLHKAYLQEETRLAGIRRRLEFAEEGEYREDIRRHASQVLRHQRLLRERLSALGEGGGSDIFSLAAGAAVGIASRGLGLIGSVLRFAQKDGDTSRAELILEGAQTEALATAELIATYLALERMAANVGDIETSHLAREIRKEEEALLGRLGDHIPDLAGRAVPPRVTEVEPAQATG